MKKDQEKTRLVERQEIYVDCTMLLKTVHSAIFDMPKKDRVIVGDRLMNYVLSMLAHFSYAWNFADVRVEETENLGRFLVWNEKKNCLGLKNKVRCA